jgi:hypothetical protein
LAPYRRYTCGCCAKWKDGDEIVERYFREAFEHGTWRSQRNISIAVKGPANGKHRKN